MYLSFFYTTCQKSQEDGSMTKSTSGRIHDEVPQWKNSSYEDNLALLSPYWTRLESTCRQIQDLSPHKDKLIISQENGSISGRIHDEVPQWTNSSHKDNLALLSQYWTRLESTCRRIQDLSPHEDKLIISQEDGSVTAYKGPIRTNQHLVHNWTDT